jgi:hypothetical protein
MLRILLAAALLTIAAPSTAHAGFLVPLIAGAAFAATTAGAIVAFGLNVAVSIGLSFAASKLLAKTPDQAPDTPGGVQLDVQADAEIPQKLLVGTAVTAGSRPAPPWTFGKRGAIDNSDMIEPIAFADHPVAGLLTLYVEEQEAQLIDADAIPPELQTFYGLNAVARGKLVNASAYRAKLAIQFYDGTQTAADELMVAALGSHPERPWTSDMVGRGRCYMRAHYIYDNEVLSGPVRWRAVINGIALYDPRKDSTVGGSGSHRFGDLSTHEFTRNLPVICYNILRGIRVADHNGVPQHFYGIENGPAASCPLDSWFAAMNEADVVIDGEPQYHGGAEISVDTEPLATVKAIVTACDGLFTETGGIYKLRLGPPGLPVLSFDDGALRANEGDSFKPALALEERVNCVTASYTSPDDGWLPKPAPTRRDDDAIAADGRRLSANLDVPMVQSASHVQRLQQQMLKRSRQSRRHTIPLPPAAFGLEPGDVVEWTSERNGYSGKLFEVTQPGWLFNLNSTIAIREIDHDDFDWNGETDFVLQPVGSLVASRPAPKIIDGFDAEGFVFTGANGVKRSAILITWDAPQDGDLTRVEVAVRRSALEPEEAKASTDDPSAGQMVFLAAVTPFTAYQVRGRFVSFNGYPTEWSLWIDVTTPDVRVIQAELSAELDAKVRQIETQFADALAELHGIADDLADAINGQAASLLERHGRSLISMGERYQQNAASIEQVAIAYANADAALAALITSLTATVGANTAAITSEQVTRANADSALAGSITSLAATVGANTAAINDESLARSGGDSALAGRLTTFLADSGGFSAEGRIRFIAAAHPGDAVATFSIELNIATPEAPDWRPCGIYLDIMSGFSRCRIQANQFTFSDPGLNFGQPFDVFTIGGGEALLNTLLRVQKIIAASIGTTELKVNGVDFTKILQGAVGNRTTLVTASGTGVLVSSAVGVLANNRPIRATLNIGNVIMVSGSSWLGSPPPQLSVRFYLDGVLQTTIGISANTAVGGGSPVWAYLDAIQLFFDYPPMSAGGHTFRVDIDAPGFASATVPAGRLIIDEMAK